MAWRSSGKSNAELVANLTKNGILNSNRVAEAMLKVDRKNYVLDKFDAYDDSPQTIGHGATISAPHMHAYAAEHLLPFLNPGSKVLDVGSGSGYLAAVLYYLVSSDEKPGEVHCIEHIPELVDWSVQNLNRDGLSKAVEDKSISVHLGDGRQGFASGGPYDAIHVGAAAPILPKSLVEQLARPGRMFIPVGNSVQSIVQVDKDAEGNVTQKEMMGVRYVPLTDREAQT
ncbi:protein-L-isoaspartate O-methyltransferase [Mycena floridula]|nr:protein-L-isoaspartate O-methyltransferase [Mycena floridula]